MVDPVKESMERVTGSAPRSCPWRSFEEPIVYDVTNAHWWLESGQVATALGDSVPLNIFEGVQEFGAAEESCKRDMYKRRKAAQDAKNAATEPPKR